MSSSAKIVTEKDLKDLFKGSLLHIATVSAVYFCATFVYSIFQGGIGGASDRLSLSSSSIMTKMNPIYARFNRLMDAPDNFGFDLYRDTLIKTTLPPRMNDPHDDDTSPPPKPSTQPTKTPTDNKNTNTDKSEKDHQKLLSYLSSRKNLDKATRVQIIERAEKLSFSPEDGKRFILAIENVNIGSTSDELFNNRMKMFVEFMDMPPKGLKKILKSSELDYIATRFTYPNIRDVVQDGSISSLKSLLPSTPKPTKTPDKTPDNNTTSTIVKAPTTKSDYQNLENNEFLFNSCLTKQDVLLEAHRKYLKASTSKDKSLNMVELTELGFISEPAQCPKNGTYSYNDGQIVCSVHGNRVNPYKEHGEYLKHFKRFNLAKDAYIEGKYKEALFLAEKIVKNNKEHTQALELLGNCQMKLEMWADAATSLAKACTTYADDGKLLYETGMCFYASGNKNLATSYMKQCINSTWKSTQRSVLKPFDYFILKDRARFTLKYINKSSYLNFLLEKPPVYDTTVCLGGLSYLRDKLRDSVSAYLGGPEIGGAKRKIRGIQSELSKLRNFETNEINKCNIRLEEARSIYKSLLTGNGPGSMAQYIVKEIKKLDDQTTFCPAGGRYYIGSSDNVDCSHHRLILESSDISTGFSLSKEARSTINEAILDRYYSQYPEKKDCHTRQTFLSKDIGRPIHSNSLSEAVKSESFDKQLLRCPRNGGTYTLKKSSLINNSYVVDCPSHGSLDEQVYLPEGKHGDW